MKPDCLVFESPNEEATARIAGSLAGVLEAGMVITLDGELGAGKTNFVRGLAEGLGLVTDYVSSPTFTIVQEYESEDGSGLPLWHFDVYRLADSNAFLELGLDEYFERRGVSLIEWADQIRDVLPADRLVMQLAVSGDEDWLEDFSGPIVLEDDSRAREFSFYATGPVSAALLKRWRTRADFPTDLEKKNADS